MVIFPPALPEVDTVEVLVFGPAEQADRSGPSPAVSVPAAPTLSSSLRVIPCRLTPSPMLALPL
jgi:hypothetical protein